MAKNKGEIDELLAKLYLIYWRDNNLNNIKTVGFKKLTTLEYFEYPKHTKSIEEVSQLSDTELETYCNSLGISISPSIIKADVIINNEAISLKSKRGALPALINHTHRKGIENVCERISLDINPLDNAINDYWIKRIASDINEDIKMNAQNNPFQAIKDSTLIPLLSYFLFKGTAKADSSISADFVYEFKDPSKFDTWIKLSPKEVAKSIIDNTTISIRSKGIPSTYKHDNPIIERDISIKKWTRFFQGNHKGTLHIRG